jgi:hypothetical protein
MGSKMRTIPNLFSEMKRKNNSVICGKKSGSNECCFLLSTIGYQKKNHNNKR